MSAPVHRPPASDVSRHIAARRLGVLALALGCVAPCVAAQQPIRLTSALVTARRGNPELRGAQEGVAAARGLERQAAAFSNPVLSYGREQTSHAGQSNAQNIVQLEQSLELGSVRGARRDAARARREAAEARVREVQVRLDADVARALAVAVSAAQRARLADQFAAVVSEAQRVGDQRLAAGDVSGYAARRLRLEAGRFAALRATTMLEQRNARVILASLLGNAVATSDSLHLPSDIADLTAFLKDMTPPDDVSPDSLIRLANIARPDVSIARAELTASLADARVTSKGRVPMPVLSAGRKDERVSSPQGSTGGFTGFVAGIAIPLAVFDRRAGALAAADATAREAASALESTMRRVARDVVQALDALRSADVQRLALAPYMGDDARRAVEAVQASYTEGELSLMEWLDALRAYQEAQSTYATLLTEVAIRRATLAQALGLPLLADTRAPGSDAAAVPSRKN